MIADLALSRHFWYSNYDRLGESPERKDAAHQGAAQGIGFGGQHPCVLTLWKPPCASRNGGFSFRA